MNQYQNTSLGAVCVNDNTNYSINYTSGSNLALGQVTGGGWQYYDNQQAFNILTERKVAEPKKEKKMAIDKNKRGLFQVILIDPKEKKMLLDKIVIADNIEDVLLEVDAGSVIKSAGLAVADVDKIVNIIGQVRKTRKNKDGEVEIINEEVTE
jgi:hypothetical protein